MPACHRSPGSQTSRQTKPRNAKRFGYWYHIEAKSVQRHLNLKHLGSHAGAPAAGLALLDVLGIVGRNNVLARDGLVELGLLVREELVEGVVEDASGSERVDVANVKAAGMD